MQLTIPEFSVVLLMGASGSGKSTFARKHFKPTEILSSDFCRGLVSDDETDQSATSDAFDLLHTMLRKRLKNRKLTVIDATNVQPSSREPLMAIAREYHALIAAIAFDLPEKVCQERNKLRPDRNFGAHVIHNHTRDLRRSLKYLQADGIKTVHVLSSVEEMESAVIARVPLWNNKQHEQGPFDIIGDIHGCFDELVRLLEKLNYRVSRIADGEGSTAFSILHPDGRKLVFVGDLVDRGPNSPDVLRLVMSAVKSNVGLCVAGNHDDKLLRKLRGKNVQVKHGLQQTLDQLESESEVFKKEVAQFLDALVSHYILDEWKLVVAHAGLKAEFHGRASGKVRSFALYGETTGEIDDYGLPVRLNWASEYRGKPMVVYGHTPIPKVEWLNNTVNLDTGCVFGGSLTALRYPEREFVSVAAAKMYYEPVKPLVEAKANEVNTLTAQQQSDDMLDLADVSGKRVISTRLRQNILIREENSIAALEVMSRFAANPKWLIYLPPTMSPCETSTEAGFLEHPNEAFAYYKKLGVPRVVCQEKEMGSRAVVIIGENESAIQTRFGISGEGIGIIYTRTGRHFFDAKETEQAVLQKFHRALTAADFWNTFQTNWAAFDCELLPWSAKAQGLLKEQYASTGRAATLSLGAAIETIGHAKARGLPVASLLTHFQERQSAAEKYIRAYQTYCWSVGSIEDLNLAPFHLLATEGNAHGDKTHAWHIRSLAALAEAESRMESKPLLKPIQTITVDLNDEASIAAATLWWLRITASGSEGMVVKPEQFVPIVGNDLIQPAVKCRGKEYLRIIYGMEYDFAENLENLRKRNLSSKRSLALREFALGIESLERFIRNEPLRAVHECAFGVLAMESEPVDPRL
jgi:protein phosphatase